jgi:hypothetical protein
MQQYAAALAWVPANLTSTVSRCNPLAASVTLALGAHKLVYLFNKDKVLCRKQGEEKMTLQDIPLSFVKSFLDFHKVKVRCAGFEARGFQIYCFN